MLMFKFRDGVEFDLQGKRRIETHHDGLYLVGGGQLIPVKDMEAGERLLTYYDKRDELVKEKS